MVCRYTIYLYFSCMNNLENLYNFSKKKVLLIERSQILLQKLDFESNLVSKVLTWSCLVNSHWSKRGFKRPHDNHKKIAIDNPDLRFSRFHQQWLKNWPSTNLVVNNILFLDISLTNSICFFISSQHLGKRENWLIFIQFIHILFYEAG